MPSGEKPVENRINSENSVVSGGERDELDAENISAGEQQVLQKNQGN
jgi:hypothetical protein